MKTQNITDAQASLQLFSGYTESDEAIFAQFVNPNAKAEPGFLVDFLGSRIRTTTLWKEARTFDGQLLGLPIPGDFHAETVEWIGLLKAVRSAGAEYVAMELGAGFGPWSIAGGAAARLRGITNIRLCAVEADSQHFQFLLQHFVDNGFDPARHMLLEAAVGTQAGVAHWPTTGNSPAAETWGSRPIWQSQDQPSQASPSTKTIKIIPANDLVLREPCWDLVHIDVQGDEVDICRSCIDELSARVRRIVAGTHSRKIDGDLLDLMWRAGWLLEHEKPAKFDFSPGAAGLETMTRIDGTQVWRNPRLIHNGDPLKSFSQEITSAIHEFRVKRGENYDFDITVRNTGLESWCGGGQAMTVAASYRWFNSEGVNVPVEGQRTQLNCSVVKPGESDTLKLRVVGLPSSGLYSIWVSMVQEGVDWFVDKGAKPLVLRVHVE